MSPALFAGFLVFDFASSITPGPNNLMLMASGANFGVRRTLPHLAGVCLGFGAMAFAMGLGLSGLFRLAPWLYVVLRWGSAAYILYLAWRMATAKGVGQGFSELKPMSFRAAAAFQWINPKAWVMVLGAVTTYADPRHMVSDVAMMSGTIVLISVPCSFVWAAFGLAVKRFLRRGWTLRLFNGTMALLLVASLYPLVIEPLGPKAQVPVPTPRAAR